MDKLQAEKIWNGDRMRDIELIDRVIKHLGLEKDAKILDIGTGFGVMAISLALAGYKVLTGEPRGNDEWRKHCEEHHHEEVIGWEEAAKLAGVREKIRFQFFDVQNLPFSDNSFDAIFMYNTLHHVKHKNEALEECFRVARPGGVVCLIEMNDYSVKLREGHGHVHDEAVDPRNYIERRDITTEVISGQFSNAFLLRKPD